MHVSVSSSSLVCCIPTYLLKRQSVGKGEALHLGAQSGVLRPLAKLQVCLQRAWPYIWRHLPGSQFVIRKAVSLKPAERGRRQNCQQYLQSSNESHPRRIEVPRRSGVSTPGPTRAQALVNYVCALVKLATC